jgi:AraC-like DNA-binding protein
MSIKNLFLGHIDHLIQKSDLHCRKLVIEAGHFGMPANASLLGYPRIIICLKGTAHFLMQSGMRAEEVRIGVREGIFIAPNRWILAAPHKQYTCLGVIFYPDFTRFYLSRGEGKHPTALVPKVIETCIVPASLSEERRSLLRLLSSPGPELGSDRFFDSILACLVLCSRDLLVRNSDPQRGKAHFTWQAACHYIAENLDLAVSRKELAAHLRIHPNHVSRLFTEFCGQSFSLYVQSQRLARARILMDDARLNISEVARLSGFSSTNYFIRIFREHYGTTPTKAR